MTQHWLVRPATVRRLWMIFIAVLASTLLAELLIERHAAVGFDVLFAFNAWYGFGACVLLVVAARLVGLVLKRPDDFYGR